MAKQNKFIGSDARDVIKKMEREDPKLREEIDKAKAAKRPEPTHRGLFFNMTGIVRG
jgi:hypothetical protein